MNLELKKVTDLFLSLPPMATKIETMNLINELTDAIEELRKEVAKLKQEAKPISAARAKRGK